MIPIPSSKTVGHLFLALCLLGIQQALLAQQISLDSCQVWAQRNFPLVQQYGLIEQSKAYSVQNANTGYLPKVSLMGQITHQSDVTQLPISLPNMAIEPLSKDQYKWYGEISQPLSDLFTMDNGKKLAEAQAAAQTQEVQVGLYQLRQRVNDLYFGTLLLDAQLAQTLTIQKDLEDALAKARTAVNNGTALKSEVDNLKAESLKTEQRTLSLSSNREGYLNMLGLLTGKTLDEGTKLVPPMVLQNNPTIARPEMELYELQKKILEVRQKQITAKNLPHLDLFFQGGMGRPGLNMLDNETQAFYIGGARLKWNISGLYTDKREKELLAVDQEGLEVQKQVFLFNTRLQLQQQNTQLDEAAQLMEKDRDIVQLLHQVTQSTAVQLENGTATSYDYLSAIHAEDRAKQDLELHKIQWLKSQYEQHTTSGNAP